MGIKITQDDESKDPTVVADEEIAAFETWMVKNLNTDPLIRAERAILKTFLVRCLSDSAMLKKKG